MGPEEGLNVLVSQKVQWRIFYKYNTSDIKNQKSFWLQLEIKVLQYIDIQKKEIQEKPPQKKK